MVEGTDKGWRPMTRDEMMNKLLRHYRPEEARVVDRKWTKAGHYAVHNVGGKYSW